MSAQFDAVETFARALRIECLSGYPWNVPPTWEESHHLAREAWRDKARRLLESRAMAAEIRARTQSVSHETSELVIVKTK